MVIHVHRLPLPASASCHSCRLRLLLPKLVVLSDALGAFGAADLMELDLQILCHSQRLLVLVLKDLLLLLDDLEARELRLAHLYRPAARLIIR